MNQWEALHRYAVEVRRELHKYPEVGFDLEKTEAIVAGELEKMGIAFTRQYGQCSLAADLGQGELLIAFRADMDALPVEELVDLPFRSCHPGKMHACGHDAHTAILLATARYLKQHEKELPCRIRLIFQPSEEGAISGAGMMVDHGVMEGVNHVLGIHCEHNEKVGVIGTHAGDYMAACIPANLTFFGKSSHATLPENGIDAVAMAVEAYDRMKAMVAREAGETPYIWNIGRLSGGHVHNVIADQCTMDISFRYYDNDFAQRVGAGVKEIAEDVCRKFGGRMELDWHVSTGPVHNDARVEKQFKECLAANGFVLADTPARMSSEDFGCYLTQVPGMLFRFGISGPNAPGEQVAHRGDFMLDEDGMREAIRAYCTYAMNAKAID